jgi:predicted amino acid-binding ACT domain protein
MPRFAISIFGRDRPGIVAAVTRVLADAGCNLEDTSMTILRGHFAMMLVVAGPARVGEPELQAGLDPIAGRLDLQVSVREVTDEVTAASGGERATRRRCTGPTGPAWSPASRRYWPATKSTSLAWRLAWLANRTPYMRCISNSRCRPAWPAMSRPISTR